MTFEVCQHKHGIVVDDILSDTTYGTAATTRVADDTLLKLGKVDEAVYAIPYIYSNWGLIYNSALLEKIDSYGEYTKGEFPKTMQGLIDLCTATKNANLKNDVTGRTVSPFSCGISVLYMDNLFYALWYQQDPASWRAFFDQNNPDAFDRSTFDNETVREAISWVCTACLYALLWANATSLFFFSLRRLPKRSTCQDAESGSV